MNLFNLAGKVAVVTGSTRGIGKVIARALSDAGAYVVISSRNINDCINEQEYFLDLGRRAYACKCDVTEQIEIIGLIQETKRVFGKIDIVISNAGGNSYSGPLVDIAEDKLDEILALNLKSAIWLARESRPFLEIQRGTFIYIGSIAGVTSNNLIGPYGLVKAAGHHLVKNLASEWGPLGVRVNGILPGVIKTDLSERWLSDKERLGRILERTPMRRIGSPEELGGAAVFLASDQASGFMTGQILVVDGGLTKHT